MSDVAALIRAFLEQEKQTLHVACPARVVSFDAVKQSCSVQPISSVRMSDTEIALPVLEDVPFCFPRAGGFTLSMPVAAGDIVTLFFSDRMLDTWRGSGRVSSPTDPRSHALADAFAAPIGVWPDGSLSSVPAAAGTAAALVGPGGGIRVDADGTVHIGTGANGLGSQALALDPAVRAQLNAINPLLTALADAVSLMAPLVAVLAAAPPAAAAITAAGVASKVARTALTVAQWPTTMAATKAKAL